MAWAWGLLFAAGLLEIAWSLALKKAEGLARPGWAAAGIGTAMVSLAMLGYALTALPLGTAYAVWVGIGAVGVAAAGMLVHREPASWGRMLSLGAIIAGVAGLHLLGG